MRTYGRTADELGNKTWHVVETDAAGRDDLVWVTTLAQCLRLQPGESPFHADCGIPAHVSVMTQIFPDYYVALTQRRFSAYFASLVITKLAAAQPTYQVDVVTHVGVSLAVEIAT